MNELDLRVGPPQEVNFQKTNFSSETSGLVSQNRFIEESGLGGSGHSNEEEHQKADYAVVGYSDVLFDESLHKRARTSALADSNGNLDES